MKSIITILYFITHFSLQAFAGSGEYEVPVSDELKPHAVFKMDKVNIVQNDEVVTLSYTLPVGLTGLELTPSSFTGFINPGKDLELTGTFGKVLCDTTRIEIKSECLVAYNESYKKYLEILDPKIEEAMIRTTTDPLQLAIRKQIWESFSGDPLGFVYFTDLSSGY